MHTGIIMATERIDHQTDAFGKNLEVLVAQLCEDIRSNDLYAKNLDGYPIVNKISDLIFRRLGIKTEIITTKLLAAILPFYANRNHIFLADLLRGNISIRDQTKLINTFNGKKGYVNLKEAEVGGIYSQYVHPLYVNFAQLMKLHEMTPAEITGVILHELGHAFSACYYSDRSDTNNQVMANLLRVVTDHDTAHDVSYIFREVQKVTDQVTQEEVDKILNGPRVIAGAVWFRAVIKIVKSQLQNDKYSDTSFEELADSFAGRFGYGKNLVLSLNKLHKDDFNRSTSMLWMCYLLEYSVFALLVGGIFSTLVGAPVGIAIYAAVVKLVIIRLSGDDHMDMTYDELTVRYKRIRNDTIDLLKDRELKPELVKNALQAIYEVDESIKSTNTRKNLYRAIANFVFSDARKAVTSIEAQQLMESLASNDLFIQAAELKTN